jgi:long-chain fatty acid transport protein
MGKLDKYAGLLANGGEMDVPAAATVGVAYQATPSTLIAADVQQVYYSAVDAIGKPADPTLNGGKGIGSVTGFGWNDVTAYKIGVKHRLNDKVALMAGYNYGKSPIGPEDTGLNVIAPGVVEQHVSLGFERKLTPKSKIIASYVHAFENEVKGNDLTVPPGVNLGGYDLKMKQDAIGVAYSVEF